MCFLRLKSVRNKADKRKWQRLIDVFLNQEFSQGIRCILTTSIRIIITVVLALKFVLIISFTNLVLRFTHAIIE